MAAGRRGRAVGRGGRSLANVASRAEEPLMETSPSQKVLIPILRRQINHTEPTESTQAGLDKRCQTMREERLRGRNAPGSA